MYGMVWNSSVIIPYHHVEIVNLEKTDRKHHLESQAPTNNPAPAARLLTISWTEFSDSPVLRQDAFCNGHPLVFGVRHRSPRKALSKSAQRSLGIPSSYRSSQAPCRIIQLAIRRNQPARSCATRYRYQICPRPRQRVGRPEASTSRSREAAQKAKSIYRPNDRVVLRETCPSSAK
jgi:hypothetical protein